MLTFDEIGTPVGIVHGGELNGEIISVVEDDNDDMYDYSSDLDIYDGYVVPLPKLDTRNVNYVAGPSGSGKSTYASIQAEKYRKLYPHNQIYIFSRLDQDPAFDGKFFPKPIRMKIDDSLLNNPIDISEQAYKNCLVIFDDIDSIQNDKLKKAVMKLENDILEVGRHNNISVICTCHLLNPNDRKFGRTILNEAHTITFFPKSGSSYQIEYMLKNYFGLKKPQIQEILGLNSRWVTCFKSYPQICIYEHGAFLLNQ